MMRPLFLLLALAVLMSSAGCASRFETVPVDTAALTARAAESAPAGINSTATPLDKLIPVLMQHLSTARHRPFANLYIMGEFQYHGYRQTTDGRDTVFLFISIPSSNGWRHIPLAPYSYIYISLDPGAALRFERNTLPGARYSNDGDGEFQGAYKLTVTKARWCSGDTDSLPEVGPQTIRIVARDKVLSKFRLKEELKYFSPLYCQGNSPDVAPERRGIRFYFDTQQEMERFAAEFLHAFEGFVTIEKSAQ